MEETRAGIYLGTLFVGLSALAQQYALFHKKDYLFNEQAVPIFINVIYLIGLIAEWIGLFYLPLSTFILISCLHVLVFKYFYGYRSVLELAGCFSILVSLLLLQLEGGIQEHYQSIEELDELINGDYFLWMICSLTFNLTMRRLGYYANKVMLETCIPAQLTAISLGATKIIILNIVHYYQQQAVVNWMVVLLSLVLIATTVINSGFAFALNLQYRHDTVVVCYYFWAIFYTLPLAFLVISAGTYYSLQTYVIEIVCSVTICLGCLVFLSHEYYPEFPLNQLSIDFRQFTMTKGVKQNSPKTRKTQNFHFSV